MFVKNSICILFILFSFQSFAYSTFKFWVAEEKLNYVINLKKRQFEKENIQGNIVFSSPLALKNIDTTLLVEDFQVVAFNKQGLFTFTLQGTGLVYNFNPQTATIERVDKTKFAGYNFLSVRFARRDSIFSFGGTGFWQTNNILTFFNKQKGEWEALCHPDIEPARFKNQISGYFNYYDKVYVLELPKLYTKDENYKPYYWSFDLNSKTWVKLGILNNEIVNSQQEIYIAGRYCFFKHFTKNLWADPGTNKLYYYSGNKSSLFSNPITIYQKDDWLFSYYKNGNQFGLDSIKTRELFENSKLLGPMYQPDLPIEPTIYILILLIGVITYMIYKRYSTLKFENEPNFESLIKQLLGLTEITTQELNKILDCENKPTETQRQIRARFISQFNHHFLIKYKIENAVIRCQSKDDKRFVIYQISMEARNVIQKFK
jgi:hypothetical protein